jgi:glycine cleavage system pyridoxal-binding protein P
VIAPSELEKLVEYRSLLEDIIELQKQVASLPRRTALAEYVVRL